jgi:hypothetical protein
MPRTPISKFLIIATFVLMAGGAGTEDRADFASAENGPDCPSWKTVVVDESRYYCVDPDVVEREIERIEDDW